MKATQETCALCAAIADATRDAPRLENTPLLATERFIVMPCIGPVVPGHVMVVSRNHYLSLASMGQPAIQEYEMLVDHMVDLTAYDSDSLLEAEHGSATGDCGAACIAHTHIHIIPGLARFADVLDGVLDTINMGQHIVLPAVETAYIMLRGARGLSRVYDAVGSPSQLVRRAICSSCSGYEPDWRAAPRYDFIEQTINLWRDKL